MYDRQMNEHTLNSYACIILRMTLSLDKKQQESHVKHASAAFSNIKQEHNKMYEQFLY